MHPIIYRHSMKREYTANKAGTGYSAGNRVFKALSVDSGAGPTLIGPAVWVNQSTQEIIKPAPPLADMDAI